MSSPKLLVLIVLAALALRLGAGAWWQSRLPGRFGFGDSQSYWALARTIAHGQPYQYGDEGKVFRTPGYPLLLAPLFLLGGDDPSAMWARALSAVLGTASVALVWVLARQLFDDRAAVLAAAIAAVEPGAVATGALVLSEAPFCPLLVAHLILWTAAWRARSSRSAAWLAMAAGAAAGAATLVRPSWLLFTPFALLIAAALFPPRMRQLGLGAAMLLGLVAVMSPWWVRNAAVTGHFVPTTLQVGASLYDGLNPQATGASNMAFVERFAEEERLAERQCPLEPVDSFEYRLDRRLRDAALCWVRANPGRAAQLAVVKLGRMWNIWPNEPTFSWWPVRLAMLLTYPPVLILAVLGVWQTLRRGWPYTLCWLPAVYFSVLHMVFVSSIRYRQPAMLALAVLAAGFFISRMDRRTRSVGRAKPQAATDH